MKSKVGWIASALLLGCGYWFWWASLWPNPYLRLGHTVAILAMLFAVGFLPVPRFRWRMVCGVAFAVAYAFALRYAPNSPYSMVPLVAAIKFLSYTPARPAMTMREAWHVLRHSRQREEERARTIIADHLKKYSI